METETNYTILLLGESAFGLLVAEEICPVTGECLRWSFFRAPKLAPKKKNKAFTPHCFLPSSALR